MKIVSSLSIASMMAALSVRTSDVAKLVPAAKPSHHERRFVPSNCARVRNMGQRYKLRNQSGAERLAALEKAEAKRTRKAKFRWNQYRNVRHLA